MEKNAKLEKAIEVFVLITFPIALIVGCAGSGNVQPVKKNTYDISAIEQSYNVKDVYPLFANDTDNIDANKSAADMVAESKEIDVVSHQSFPPMVKVSFTEDTETKNEVISESETAMQDQPLLLVVADTSDNILTVGANSSLALMDNVEIQPNYLTFNFDSDSVTVHEYDHYFLKQHAAYLNSNPNLILKLSGHTDSHGSKIYNEELSKRRANAVTTLLISFGAPESQIQTKGLGEIVPVSEDKEWRENRRVELEYIDNTMISAK